MSSIQSPVPAVRILRINAFPSRPKAGLKIVRIDRVLVGVGVDGACYSTEVKDAVYYTRGFKFSATFRGLLTLKVLTKEQVEEHQEWVSARNTWRDKHYAAGSFRNDAATLGINLTPKQIAICNAVRASKEPE